MKRFFNPQRRTQVCEQVWMNLSNEDCIKPKDRRYQEEPHEIQRSKIISSNIQSESFFNKYWKKFSANRTTEKALEVSLMNYLIEVSSKINDREITLDINDFLKSKYGLSKGARSNYIHLIFEREKMNFRNLEREKLYFEEQKIIAIINKMTGVQFEKFVIKLLTEMGAKCSETPYSSDFGADVIASIRDIKIAIQCKRYKDKVGFDAVKEAHVGKDFYKCNYAWVVSNATYSKQAVEASKRLKVRLINIVELMNGHFEFNSTIIKNS